MTPNVGVPDAPPVITPPKLVTFADPTYPPDALAQGVSARVELEIVIGTDGHVADAKVKTAAGSGFDEAALEAGRRLIFEPAKRNGTPVAARIVFPYVFEFQQPEAPPEEEAAPLPAQLTGRVLEAGSDDPVPGVEVIVSGNASSQIYRAVSATDGRFAIEELPAGTYRVGLTKKEWASQEADELLTAGDVTEVVYRLIPAEDTEAFHATARVQPPPREVTRRTITKEELTRIPGTRGDALRSVELLPGVARPPFGSGQLIVRGSAPADSQYLLEGIPVGLLYHFGGLTSFINSRLLESVDFYPGNFSVRYGRHRGGIIEITLADPARDRLHGVADINLIDGSLLVQGPITSKWDFAAAARRSWLDVTLGAALSQSNVSTVAAPVYYDYQLLTTYRPTDNDRLRLMVYGSSDTFKLLFQQPTDQDPTVSGNFRLVTQFHRIQGSWTRKVSDRVDEDLEVAVGALDLEFGVGDAYDFSLKGAESYLRNEWRLRVTDRVRMIIGLDNVLIPARVIYGGPPIGQGEGNPNANTTAANRSRVDSSDSFVLVQPALYLESDLDLAPFRIVLGSRVDYFNDIQQFSFDPRLTAFYSFSDNFRLKAGVGGFTQPPQYQESSPAFGNPHLRPTHTIHVDAGFDATLAPGIKVGVEGFYKHLYDRIIGTQFGEAPTFTNGGKGRVYGMEVSAKVDPRGRFFGYLSFTLSRSQRLDPFQKTYQLFDFDQPHILTVSGVYRLGRGWEAGLTFRLTSGNLTTPVIAALFNKDTGLYSPVYGPVNSLRTPYFHRLDLRVEKQWTFSTWKLAVYLDVQNVYNSTNQEGIQYDFEYHQMTPISGIPILPSLGARGEL
jgi:TonB family protein